ncbi:MAG: hypothetical protein H3C47_09015 [Candidatus Cloacimonetes bacterium]|nr:hypothetical protein [Candidatus Cloacimonadota bacterium]
MAWNHKLKCFFRLSALSFLFVAFTQAQGGTNNRGNSSARTVPASQVLHPGDVPGEVTPEQLQFMLDLGGDGANKEMPLYMEMATQYAIDKHTKVQKTAYIAAALEVLEAPPKAKRPRVNSRGGYTTAQRQEIQRMVASENAERQKRLRMIATGLAVVKEFSAQELAGLLGQFEKFHWDYFNEHATESLKTFERGDWDYLGKLSVTQEELKKEENRSGGFLGFGETRTYASYRDKVGMGLIVAGMFMGGYLEAADLLPEPSAETGPQSAPPPESWTRDKLPKIKAEVLSIKEWLEFTGNNQIIQEFDKDGNPVYSVVGDDMVKAPLNNAIDRGVVSPILKAIIQRNSLKGWLKFLGESKIGPRLVQFALQTTELGNAIANTAVMALDQVLRGKNQRLLVRPEFLTHKFAQTVHDFAHKFDIKLLKNYSAESAVANLSEVEKAGLAKTSGMTLLRRAFARAFALEAAIDISFRLGGAVWQGHGNEEVQIGDSEYQVGGRTRIQMTGDSSRDSRRQRSAAVEAAWDDWNRNAIQNTGGYIAGGLATAVATPFVFGVAAAAGAPTAGVGAVVVAVAGYAAVGAAAYTASTGARSLLEGVDDGVNLWRVEDRLKGIFSDMIVNRDKDVSQSESIITRVVDAAKVRYVNKQDMKYMAFVASFDKVTLKKENGLTQLRLHQDHGNFLDSDRVAGWENYFRRGVTHVATLGISTMWRQFSDWRQGEEAKIETREARLLHDFYDLAGNQAQWDDFPDKIVPIGPISNRGVVFVGTPGDKVEISNGIIRGTEDESDIRILSNGLVMSRNERNRQRWVIKGRCADYDIFIRSEVSGAAGRYSCLNNTYRYVRALNMPGSRPPTSTNVRPSTSAPRSATGTAAARGPLDEGLGAP